MGTRHNVVFLPNKHAIKFNNDGKLSKNCIKYAPKIYVHWDGYPLGGYDEETKTVFGGALPILRDFLNTDGARARANDEEYLSAYYVGWKIIHDFEFTNLKEIDDFRSIGVESTLNGWADYTYIVKPESTSHDSWKFVIYVLDYNLKLIKKVENINNLEAYKDVFLNR